MDVTISYTAFIKIKFFLIFFCVPLLQACQESSRDRPPVLEYEDNRPVAVSFGAEEGDGIRVYLAGEEVTPVLGSFAYSKGQYTFRPAVPFTAGLQYVIRQGQDSLSSFRIPREEKGLNQPELLAIYPQQDTVPENLLKCYLEFSEPMQSVGRVLDFIRVTDLHLQRDVEVFLDMEAELWDRDHKILTLWLDPGRIKTDLIPNKTLGTPIREGRKYLLTILAHWRSARGMELSREYKNEFYVEAPDRQRLNPATWTLSQPGPGTGHALAIDFQEGVDLVMAREYSTIVTEAGERVGGQWVAEPSGTSMSFIPEQTWVPGKYRLLVDAKVEDLAGNTVNRLFDTKIGTEKEVIKPLLEIEKDFVID